MTLPVELATELARYHHALARAPLTGAARLTYIARIRGFLTWLAANRWPPGQTSADPLQHRAARDAAVRDWQMWALTVEQTPVTINSTLAAIEDFYSRRRLRAATARQQPLPRRPSTPAP
jgi:hypothetical protein